MNSTEFTDPRMGTINRRRSDGGLTIRDFFLAPGCHLTIGKDHGVWTTPEGVTTIQYGEE